MNASNLPLAGIRILDLTQVQFGPCATQVLGDFGAEIVKIERPGAGDLSRKSDGHIQEPQGQSAYFMAMNRNKRSLALDLSGKPGRKVLAQLVDRADVLVHNFRPGVAERLGLDFPTLHASHPRLIYASGSGFGPTGPLAHKGGQDILAQSLSGMMARNTDATGHPQIFPIALGDFASGMILVQGILLALVHRERAGEGQKVEVNLLDVLVTMQQQEVTQWLLRQKEVNWVKQRLTGVFRTLDGAITLVGSFHPNLLQAVCQALELPDYASVPDYQDPASWIPNRETLLRLMAPGFAKFSTQACLRRLDEQDILCAPLLSLDDALKHEQLTVNKTLIEIEHPVHGSIRTPGNPLHMSAHPQLSTSAPPLLGQHTDAVLSELGYSEQAIKALREAAVVA